MRVLFFLFLVITLSVPALGQVIFPVSVTSQSVPPHTGNLEDLTTPATNRIGISLLLRDAEEINYQVRLKVTVEGNGIVLTTRENFLPRPINLSFGMPELLAGADLAEYFDPANLDFSGYDLNSYLQNGGLPDGIYSICFEVFDFDRNEAAAVSLQSCTVINAILHDPPEVLAPIGPQIVTDPQNLPLLWQARHTGAFPTEYTIEIYDYDPRLGLSPELAIDYEQPLFTRAVTMVTASQLTAADPPLEPGRRYLIRIRAQDVTMANRFKNEGWSAPEVFFYGESCAPPTGVRGTALSSEAFAVSWVPATGVDNNYLVRFRRADLPQANWYESTTSEPLTNIEELEANTEYEFQVASDCGGENFGEFSPLARIRTDSILESEDCDYDYSPPLIMDETPVAVKIGDLLDIGGFDLLVTYAETSADDPLKWNGVGRVRVLWLAVWINVYFEEVSVNEAGQIFAGDVIAPSTGLESLDGFVSPQEVYANQLRMDSVTNFCGIPLTNPAPPVSTPPTGGWQPGDDPPFDGEGLIGSYIAANNQIPPVFGLGGVNLPFSLGSGSSIIALDNMTFTQEGASLGAYASFEVNSDGGMGYVSFRSELAFHPSGFREQPKLFLANDASFVMLEKAKLKLIAGPETFVKWSCKGIESISVKGEIDFCKDLILAADPVTETLDSTRTVKGAFTTVMPEWKDFTANVSIEPFALRQLPDWVWTAQTAILDLSDVFTPPEVKFPTDYAHPDMVYLPRDENGALLSEEDIENGSDDIVADSIAADTSGAWKGIYFGQLEVKLPQKFTQQEEGETPRIITVGTQDVIIDRTGFSGYVYGNDLLTLEEGNVGTYAFSIDTLGIGLQSNQFVLANFYGKMVAPPFPVDTLGVRALIQPDSGYVITVEILEELSMDLWAANLTLKPNSAITIDYLEEDDSFGASILLHGSAAVYPSMGDPADTVDNRVALAKVNFQDFALRSRGNPIKNIGSWSLESTSAKAGPFNMVVHEMAVFQDTAANEVIMGLDAEVILTPADGGEFSGRGAIRIVGEIAYNELIEEEAWRFKTVLVDRLAVNASTGGMTIKGDINFYRKDPYFGSGFRGQMEATFTPGIGVQAIAQFGNVAGTPYFFVDGLVSKNPGVPIASTGLALYGFGGGAFYHMRRAGPDPIPIPNSDDPEALGSAEDIQGNLGESLSGAQYIVDPRTLIGIKATVLLGTITRTTFSGDATLEVTINAAGGLDQVTFEGQGRFMTPVDGAGQPTSDPALTCDLLIVYDHALSSLHANLGTYLNLPPMRGGYPENYAGEGVLHFDPNDWYIYVGVPETPIKLKMDVTGLDHIQPLDVSMGGYFDMGTILPAFPPLPSEVSNILGDLNLVGRDDPAFADAAGVLFGANMDISIPGLNFLMFYASFSAGAGFDVMLKDYQDAVCAFNADNPNAGPPGINGYYATGQLYAYMQGEVGIRVSIPLGFKTIRRNIKILEIGAAAVLQARLPNPIWAKGKVGGYFSILGGMVSGHCSFKFEMGQRCDIVGTNPLAGIEFIGDTSPENGDREVSVFVKPRVAFNIPPLEVLELEDDEGNEEHYRAILHELMVLDKETMEEIPTDFQYLEDGTVRALRPIDILPGETSLIFRIVLRFEIWTTNEAQGYVYWEDLLTSSGEIVEEVKEINFVSGEAPNYIPQENIAYSYPVERQLNLHRADIETGYLDLVQGQDYLFEDPENVIKVRYIQNGAVLEQATIAYDTEANRATFPVATGLADATISQAVLLNIPTTAEEAIDANVVGIETELFSNQDETLPDPVPGEEPDFTSILMAQQRIEQETRVKKEVVVTTFNFRTSQYPQLAQKLDAMTFVSHYFEPIFLSSSTSSGATINDMGTTFFTEEGFDRFELYGYDNGVNWVEPLLQVEGDLNQTGGNWYQEDIFPMLYSRVPTPEINLRRRNPAIFGQVPTRAAKFRQFDGLEFLELTDEAIETNTYLSPSQSIVLTYSLPQWMKRDHIDYKNTIYNYYFSQPIPSNLLPLMDGTFIYPRNGDYFYQVNYRLPARPYVPRRADKIIYSGE